MIRLMCATIYVFNPEGTHTLLMHHRKLGKWVPPGGKIDPNEIPDHAALREVKEETGLTISLLGEVAPVVGGYVRPFGVQLNEVIPGKKEHIDLIYIGIPVDTAAFTLNEREATDLKWFTIYETQDPTLNTFPSVRIWVQKFSAEVMQRAYRNLGLE